LWNNFLYTRINYFLMVHFQSLWASFRGPCHGFVCSLSACRREGPYSILI